MIDQIRATILTDTHKRQQFERAIARFCRAQQEEQDIPPTIDDIRDVVRDEVKEMKDEVSQRMADLERMLQQALGCESSTRDSGAAEPAAGRSRLLFGSTPTKASAPTPALAVAVAA